MSKRLREAEMPSEVFERVSSIIESARGRIVRSVNHELVTAYWSIGREIVQELQAGDQRAEYGKHVLESLANYLVPRYGSHFNYRNLNYFRQFFVTYALPGKVNTVCSESENANPNTACSHSSPLFDPALSWSHYRLLMRVEKADARDFYETETARQGWSVRQLERQINSLFYERLLKSHDKQGMLGEANEANDPLRPIDVIKDPYVLEFLDLPESHRLREDKLESALISTLQDFLLELGSGFAFVARQMRICLDGDHFYPDLVFYHISLRCYVVIDLKVNKLNHGDLGQMQMYVGYFDREVRTPNDNPTIGLVLCSEKNDSMVKYVLGEGNEQIFASRYRLELPDEETLRRELERERALIRQSHITR